MQSTKTKPHNQPDQPNLTDQDLSDMAVKLSWWRDLFNAVFFQDQPCPAVTITLKRTNVTTLSHSVFGDDLDCIENHLNLNPVHLNRAWWDVLATLVHEMTHIWQAVHGTPSETWYHNKEFRIRLAETGVYCDEKGDHVGLGDPFVFLMQRHGVSLADTQRLAKSGSGVIQLPPQARPKGHSKLKLWQCACGQKARVGRKDFQASCDLCRSKFKRID